ncbi:FMN-dependent NADH-azoreductase [Pararcticibacter amylolyticus]|uniref:FMN dependent NADH:quinone oxidoreductase n=1 Tax=Pararcticibacter amylolyticus TaxID=2173175 RepID=A0A2U2PH10_9SPHI|nr:FMN-dependent NADH-azoreductase [Pararcticibacter amylolyticus]PWG80542.1 FMN-dependent NADH-azoreductase [Pararcticibacter amylolyticus]
MKTILHLISSPRQESSLSIQLGKAIVAQLQQTYPDSTVNEVNLIEENFPHLDAPHLQSFFTPRENLTPADQEAIRYSERAIGQLMEADFIVVGAPLYNFSIHSALKAWIDHIARAGVTFRYSEQGPEGLVKGKKVYIAMSSGGVYSEGPYQPYDFVVPYLKAVLGFLGMTDITVYRAEGANIPGLKEHALEKAIGEISIDA